VTQLWTRPAEVRAWLDKKWQSGTLLTAFAEDRGWEPLSVPLRGPAAGEIAERLAEVQDWAAEWTRAGSGTSSPLRVEYKRIGGRQVGTNMIPCRAWIDGYDQAWELLGVRAQVRRFRILADATAASCPRLLPWLTRRPMQLLKLADRWDKLLATVRWIDERQSPGMYLRQVDVPGVDTKFIERHRGVLAELLDLQLVPGRFDAGATDFAARYRFRRKPGYVRFRSPGFAGFTELSVRADEFAAPPPETRRAYVVENELAWLRDLDLVYWGDIDTHGFVILNRLRHRFRHAHSMLMDRATLLAHRDHWVTEPHPTAASLDCLDASETELYRDLIDGALGPSVRLEQERISFAAIEQALSAHALAAPYALATPRCAMVK
jgi:hypothetical protein